MQIHPTAIIESGAELHQDVCVGPYSIIESGAVIGAGCQIASCVKIFSPVRLGSNNYIDHGVVLGAAPQDLSFTPERVRLLVIGAHNHFREGVNISCGFKSPQGTRIGSYNYWMAFSHAGHDCLIGDHNIFANGATLAGHVEIADWVFLSGQVAVHQFCRIGSYVLVGGISGVAQDVPPYVLADGHRARIIGLNTIGLKRHCFTLEQRNRIKNIYRLLFRSTIKRAEAIQLIEREYPSLETNLILQFLQSSRRGLISFTNK